MCWCATPQHARISKFQRPVTLFSGYIIYMASIWKTEKYTTKAGKIYQRYALDADGNKQLRDGVDPSAVLELHGGPKKVKHVIKETITFKPIDQSDMPLEKLVASKLEPWVTFRGLRSETDEWKGYKVVERIVDEQLRAYHQDVEAEKVEL